MANSDLRLGFQSSVFDRLIEGDSADPRGLTESQLFEVVRRDLEELLNTRRPTFQELGIDGFEHIQKSIMGYGLPDFSKSREVNEETRRDIALEVERAIATFEPRLTDVQVTVHNPDDMKEKLKNDYQQLAVYFHVSAKLRMDPSPPVAFETVLELAQGRHVVRPGEA